jgi:precorrin-6B C5,15-methyltransferase / cobalt-precorrin-6B C5,C15-methyltransferase
MAEPPAPPVDVVGLVGGECFGAGARAALDDADVVVGSPRQLAGAACGSRAMRLELTAALDDTLDAIALERDAGRRVTVLASGDPGFFGIVRVLAARFGHDAVRVHPAPSSVSLAFARLGMTWDDADVVSAHGRSLDAALDHLVDTTKAAVLTSPDNPPEAVGTALVERGRPGLRVAVFSRIGEAGESEFHGDVAELARGSFDPMSVVVLSEDDDTGGAGLGAKTVAWGLPEDRFAHRDGMITKAEVRAVALGKLALPRRGVLWDVGAGSGSVAIEAARLAPGLRVFAVEHDRESADRIRANAIAHDVCIHVVHGRAPEALAPLPDPDRVFVGGGGLDALDAALARLTPDGVVVANFALLDRAVAGWQRLGNLVEVSVSRGMTTGDEHVRLASENPVFVCWGPG